LALPSSDTLELLGLMPASPVIWVAAKDGKGLFFYLALPLLDEQKLKRFLKERLHARILLNSEQFELLGDFGWGVK
jgi:hypothetical protein